MALVYYVCHQQNQMRTEQIVFVKILEKLCSLGVSV